MLLQGVAIQDLVVPRDMVIPTNTPGTEQAPIALSKGQRVMVIRTPKGIYLRMGEKIIKIKLPQGLLGDMQQQQQQQAMRPDPSEVVTLSDSDEEQQQLQQKQPQGLAQPPAGPSASSAKDLYDFVTSATSSATASLTSSTAAATNGAPPPPATDQDLKKQDGSSC